MCRRVDEFDLEVREIVTYNLTTSQGNTTLRWCLIIAEWIPYLPVTATFPAYPVTRPQWQHLQIFWGYQLDATIMPFPPTFPPGTVMGRAYPGPGTDTGNQAPRYYPAPGAPSAVPQGSTVRPAGAPAAYPIATPAEPTGRAPAR